MKFSLHILASNQGTDYEQVASKNGGFMKGVMFSLFARIVVYDQVLRSDLEI